MNYSIVFYKKKDADQEWSTSYGILASGCHEIGVISVIGMKAGTDVYLDVKLSIITMGNGAVVSISSRNNPLRIFSPVAQNILCEGLTGERLGISEILGDAGGLGGGHNFFFCINHWNLLLSCLYTVDRRTVFVLKCFKYSNCIEIGKKKFQTN